MIYFADGINIGELSGIFTIFAAMLAGFFAIARIMLTQASGDRDADRLERQALSKAIEHMAKTNESGNSATKQVAETNKLIAKSVDKQSKESAQRNGHLAELIIKQGEQTQMIADKAVHSIVTKVQNVEEQTVEHQHVKEQA